MKKKRMIFLMSLLALLLPLSVVHAQDTSETELCMVLTQKDGTVSTFALKENPVVTYEGENIVVSCGEQQLSTPLSGIENFKFEETIIDAITPVSKAQPMADFSFNKASFSGLATSSVVRVYTIDGKALLTSRADADGNASIDLGTLPRGIYIIRTATQSYKIKK